MWYREPAKPGLIGAVVHDRSGRGEVLRVYVFKPAGTVGCGARTAGCSRVASSGFRRAPLWQHPERKRGLSSRAAGAWPLPAA